MSDTGRQSLTDKATAALKVCVVFRYVCLDVIDDLRVPRSPTLRSLPPSTLVTSSRATLTPLLLLSSLPYVFHLLRHDTLFIRAYARRTRSPPPRRWAMLSPATPTRVPK